MDTDREDEADARRLIRGRGIEDRWRRIDRCRVVARGGLIPVHTPATVMTVAVIPFAPMIIFGEGRRDGYTADH